MTKLRVALLCWLGRQVDYLLCEAPKAIDEKKRVELEKEGGRSVVKEDCAVGWWWA